jgi:hypothetical protein
MIILSLHPWLVLPRAHAYTIPALSNPSRAVPELLATGQSSARP